MINLIHAIVFAIFAVLIIISLGYIFEYIFKYGIWLVDSFGPTMGPIIFFFPLFILVGYHEYSN